MALIPTSWAELASASQIVQLVVVIAGLLYAKRQLDEVIRSRRLMATKEIVSEIGSVTLRKIRGEIYKNFHSPITRDQVEHLNSAQLEDIRTLAVAYDRIAFLVHLKIIREDDLFRFQGEEIRRVWNTIENVVHAYREQNDRANYCHHIEALAKRWNSR